MLITNPRIPIPIQVRNNIASVLVRKLIPVNPSDTILPLYITTYIPKIRCTRFNNIGASTPSNM